MTNLAGVLALSAALGMGVAPGGAAATPGGPPLMARMCGGQSAPQPLPLREREPGGDCPGACHATCTRNVRDCECDEEDAN